MQATRVKTPPGGINHREAQNTENTGVILAQLPATGNQSQNEPAISPDDYLRQLAKGNTAKLLAKAANYASMHAPHTLWQRRMKLGRTTVVVRLQWPGTLCVFDPATGDKLAESLPGQPETLQNQ